MARFDDEGRRAGGGAERTVNPRKVRCDRGGGAPAALGTKLGRNILPVDSELLTAHPGVLCRARESVCHLARSPGAASGVGHGNKKRNETGELLGSFMAPVRHTFEVALLPRTRSPSTEPSWHSRPINTMHTSATARPADVKGFPVLESQLGGAPLSPVGADSTQLLFGDLIGGFGLGGDFALAPARHASYIAMDTHVCDAGVAAGISYSLLIPGATLADISVSVSDHNHAVYVTVARSGSHPPANLASARAEVFAGPLSRCITVPKHFDLAALRIVGVADGFLTLFAPLKPVSSYQR